MELLDRPSSLLIEETLGDALPIDSGRTSYVSTRASTGYGRQRSHSLPRHDSSGTFEALPPVKMPFPPNQRPLPPLSRKRFNSFSNRQESAESRSSLLVEESLPNDRVGRQFRQSEIRKYAQTQGLDLSARNETPTSKGVFSEWDVTTIPTFSQQPRKSINSYRSSFDSVDSNRDWAAQAVDDKALEMMSQEDLARMFNNTKGAKEAFGNVQIYPEAERPNVLNPRGDVEAQAAIIKAQLARKKSSWYSFSCLKSKARE